jgi:hypothetical protein
LTWDLPVPMVVLDCILKQSKGDRAFLDLLLIARDLGYQLFVENNFEISFLHKTLSSFIFESYARQI